MLIAHFSDPHILFLRHAIRTLPSRKQLLGLVNWLLRRRRIHQRERLTHAVEYLVTQKPDAVVVTGDLCQLAYPGDYTAFALFLRPLKEAGIPVLLLRGNHDHYSPSPRSRVFYEQIRKEYALGAWKEGGIAEIKGAVFLPVDGAVPTPSFECWGSISDDEINRLRQAALSFKPTGNAAKMPAPLRIAFGHFPLLGADGHALPEKMALRNAAHVLTALRELGVAGYLCGHVHKPFTVPLAEGITQYCSGSLTACGVLRMLRATPPATAQERPLLEEIEVRRFA